MITVRVKFEDGNSLVTGINGTIEEARQYYLGRMFNFGDSDWGDTDRLVRAVEVEVFTEDSEVLP